MEKYRLFKFYSLSGRISQNITLQLCKDLHFKMKVQYLKLFSVKLHQS